MNELRTRACKKCGQEKPLSRFPPCKTCKFGVSPTCRKCRSTSPRGYLSEDAFFKRIKKIAAEYCAKFPNKEGDAMDSERVLTEELSRSRASIREFLTIMQYLGHIRVMHGKGRYIKKPIDPEKLKGG